MKLENKHLAQERRAQERKKQKQKKVIKSALLIIIALAILALIIALIIMDAQKAKQEAGSLDDNSSYSSTEATDLSTNDSPDLNTDTALTVEDGDTVNLDFVGSVDGVEFVGGNSNGMGYDLVIGSHSFVDDFEEQLIGHNVGDNFDITVTFPDGYGSTQTVDGDTVSLDNKDVVFNITLNGIYK